MNQSPGENKTNGGLVVALSMLALFMIGSGFLLISMKSTPHNEPPQTSKGSLDVLQSKKEGRSSELRPETSYRKGSPHKLTSKLEARFKAKVEARTEINESLHKNAMVHQKQPVKVLLKVSPAGTTVSLEGQGHLGVVPSDGELMFSAEPSTPLTLTFQNRNYEDEILRIRPFGEMEVHYVHLTPQ